MEKPTNGDEIGLEERIEAISLSPSFTLAEIRKAQLLDVDICVVLHLEGEVSSKTKVE